MDKMFDELDKNYDGQLSWQEFIGEETTIERAFKLFDENNDGTISKAVSQEKYCQVWVKTPNLDSPNPSLDSFKVKILKRENL